MTTVEYHVTGLSLTVSPSTLTIPRDVDTQLDTTVPGADTLPATAAIRATLRGPSFPFGTPLIAGPGEPLPIPALSQPGLHFVEDIRLDVDATVSIPAEPATVPIEVLDQILVGAVSARPLTLDEIRARGIVIDENDFQAFKFTIAFTLDSGTVIFGLPMFVRLGDIPESAPRVIPIDLPPEIEGGGSGARAESLALMLTGATVAPFLFDYLPDDKIKFGTGGMSVPGILIIPGNVAFLNQFFDVMLLVANQSPRGTRLTVRDVTAEILLPPGPDLVVGDVRRDPPFRPADPEYDNPLRVARTAAGRENLKPILAPGPDGTPGTADDVDRLAPGESGMASFLVEGVRQGGHVIGVEMAGVIDGLPGGPKRIRGRAEGAVVVRDPTFALSFIHPRTVRAGELYDLTVNVKNTSNVDANLVTVSLDPRNMTGARIVPPHTPSRTVETIPPGESATLTFTLEALTTGRVSASTLEIEGDEGHVTGRRLSLRTGVSEQGVPLSPDEIVLPQVTKLLEERSGNPDLLFRAVALLGEALSIVTSPRGSLPPGIRPIPRTVLTQRVQELASAAYRLRYSVREGAGGQREPLPEGLLETLQDLYFDWLGARSADPGWDALFRVSRQARLFGAAVMEIVTREARGLGIDGTIALQRRWADVEVYRGGHVTVATRSHGAHLPVHLDVRDATGRRLGGSLDRAEAKRQIPYADVLRADEDGEPVGQLALLPSLSAPPYTARVVATGTGVIDVGVVVPGPDAVLQHAVFAGLAVDRGDVLKFAVQPGADPPVTLERGDQEISPSSVTAIAVGAPRVIGVTQDAEVEEQILRSYFPKLPPPPWGGVVAVLFDRDVDHTTAEDASSFLMEPANIPMLDGPDLVDTNQVMNAQVQFGDRIVLMSLRDSTGPFVERRVSIAGVKDASGVEMEPDRGRRIEVDPALPPGGMVTGTVLLASGSPLPGADIKASMGGAPGLPKPGQTQDFTGLLAAGRADVRGRYAIDFVPIWSVGFGVRATDTLVGGKFATASTSIRYGGERMTLDLVLVGRGAVDGVVRDEAGAPVAGATVQVNSATNGFLATATTDQRGYFRFDDVPVGAVFVVAASSTGVARATVNLAADGAVAHVDLTFASSADPVQAGVVLNGQVRNPDGSPASRLVVTLSDTSENVSFGGAVVSDEAGAFRFTGVVPGPYKLSAVDKARGFAGMAGVVVGAPPEEPPFAVVVLSGTGTVTGRVFERVGGSLVAGAGALVGGGLAVVTADAEGRYTLPDVPVGTRTITAANRGRTAAGARMVRILTAGQVASGIDIVMESVPLPPTVSGVVYAPDGQPAANANVILVICIPDGDIPCGPPICVGGPAAGAGCLKDDDCVPAKGGTCKYPAIQVTQTTTTADGSYRLAAPSPGEWAMVAKRGSEVANGTAQVPDGVPEAILDMRLLRTGRVSGRVVDETGLAVAASVGLEAVVPRFRDVPLLNFDAAGGMTSDPDTGFLFSRLIYPGPFRVTARSFFAPDAAVLTGVLPAGNPVAENLTLVLAKNKGRLSGCILEPDGDPIEPLFDADGIPLPLPAFIRTAALKDPIRVDASEGCYRSSIPLPAGSYMVEVTDDRPGSDTFGLTAQASRYLRRDEQGELDVRLLGLGALAIEVVDRQGTPLQGVRVKAVRDTYPGDVRTALATEPTDLSPVVFTGLSEGPVSVSAVVSGDAAVDVGGREELRGYGGRARGVVVRDATETVRIVVDAAGSIRGRLLATDGATPIRGGVVTFGGEGTGPREVTAADGRFEFVGVQVGSVGLHGRDPATAREGRTTATVAYDGHVAHADIVLGAIGSVTGVVLDVDGAPAAGADVQLGVLSATTGPSGEFSLSPVPAGPFTVYARDGDAAGTADGRIDVEGQVADVVVQLAEHRPDTGRVEGVVHDAFGAPAALAQVTIEAGQDTLSAQVDQTGHYALENVPLGHYRVEARPPNAVTPGEGAAGEVTITRAGETVPLDLTFEGTVSVRVSVSGAVGVAPIEVAVQSAGLFGGTMQPVRVEDGVFVYEGVPRAPFTATAKQRTPAGFVISASESVPADALPPPDGQVPDIHLVLEPVGSVRAVVTRPDAAPPGKVLLRLEAGGRTFHGLTSEDGRFEFVGIPLDVDLELVASERSGGRARFEGRMDAGGAVRDGEDAAVDPVPLLLDLDAPEVVDVRPADGAARVPTDTSVILTFSDPIDPATVVTCEGDSEETPTISLFASDGRLPLTNEPENPCDDSNVVRVVAEVTPDGRTVMLHPEAELGSETPYVVHVPREVVGGSAIVDRFGRLLQRDFTSRFVTRDNIPPTVKLVSPADGATGVLPETRVRVTFDEPIDVRTVDATTVAVTSGGEPVAGRLDFLFGDTVVLFTPAAPLATDSEYDVAIRGVADKAGNLLLPEDAVEARFFTVDTTAPGVEHLEAPEQAREGEVVVVSAVTTAVDVTAVDFFVNGAPFGQPTVPAGPGLYVASFVMPGEDAEVQARATDATGNVGPLAGPVLVRLRPEEPPVTAIAVPAAGAVVRRGDVLRVTVDAIDDEAVAELRVAASGAFRTTAIRQIVPAMPAVSETFDLLVPAGTIAGPATVSAIAIDAEGRTSATAAVAIVVAECLSAGDCADGNACTADSCTDGRCLRPAVADGTACSDGLFCTVDDACAGGRCAGAPRDCSALDAACRQGVCDEAARACGARPRAVGTPCDDGDACTPEDRCAADGTCDGTGTLCGNGALEPACGEQCDDGNRGADDGCSAACLIECPGGVSGVWSGTAGEPFVALVLDDGEGGLAGVVYRPGLPGSATPFTGTRTGRGVVGTAVAVQFEGEPPPYPPLAGTVASCDRIDLLAAPNVAVPITRLDAAVCGDGVVEGDEECDDGNLANGDACAVDCRPARCGNLVLEVDAGEECDDGDRADGDGCSSDCLLSVCGNGRRDAGEECDDGNVADGDGCSSACELQVCGNGEVERGEECDDGNVLPGDGCTPDCLLDCVGGLSGTWVGGPLESLRSVITDDGAGGLTGVTYRPGHPADVVAFTATVTGDRTVGSRVRVTFTGELPGTGPLPELAGAVLSCEVIAFEAAGGLDFFLTRISTARCGDGTIEGGEECDDGNLVNGDACTVACEEQRCGNGIVEPGEGCDDGNLAGGDGCSVACEVQVCGNGVRESGEDCDGADLGGQTCAGLGFRDGPLACTTQCTFDPSGCRQLPACRQDADCDDRNPCTADRCDPDQGCRHTPIADGMSCSDGNLCNGAETCRAGACGAGTPLACDDGNACSLDRCDPGFGCASTPLPACGAADADGDGVPDDVERLLGLDPGRPDSDGDGIVDGDEDFDDDALSNAGEVLLGRDPGSNDSDGDGIRDGDEDTDLDRVSDGAEVRAGTNPTRPDTDGDGIADVDEPALGTSPTSAASRPATTVRSPLVAFLNAFVADRDGDGVTDGEEAAAGTDPADPRSRTPVRVQSALVAFLNAFVADADGDEVADGDEQALGTDPHDPASRPAVRVQSLPVAYLNTVAADSDGDGVADVDERAAGTSPTDAASRSAVLHVSPVVSYRND